MNNSSEIYKKRHLDFWSMNDVSSPLIGFTVGAGLDSWTYWKYNPAFKKLLNKGKINPEHIQPKDFLENQLDYLISTESIEDDIVRSAMPFASIPWMEAIMGCPIYSNDNQITSKSFLEEPNSDALIPFNPDNPWIKKYIEFIKTYDESFSNRFPVSQSIIRGPSDIACAMLGVDNASIALLTKPDEMLKLLEFITSHLEEFLTLQLSLLPKYKDGYVIGQYEIWAPEQVLRIQEDFSVLYSPELYCEFLKPLDKRLASMSDYSLIHLHSTSLFLIKQFLDISEIAAFQITKDPDGVLLKDMIHSLKEVQDSGKPLILKGQFENNDIELMKRELSCKGLCIQPVVRSIDEASELLPIFRKW